MLPESLVQTLQNAQRNIQDSLPPGQTASVKNYQGDVTVYNQLVSRDIIQNENDKTADFSDYKSSRKNKLNNIHSLYCSLLTKDGWDEDESQSHCENVARLKPQEIFTRTTGQHSNNDEIAMQEMLYSLANYHSSEDDFSDIVDIQNTSDISELKEVAQKYVNGISNKNYYYWNAGDGFEVEGGDIEGGLNDQNRLFVLDKNYEHMIYDVDKGGKVGNLKLGVQGSGPACPSIPDLNITPLTGWNRDNLTEFSQGFKATPNKYDTKKKTERYWEGPLYISREYTDHRYEDPMTQDIRCSYNIPEGRMQEFTDKISKVAKERHKLPSPITGKYNTRYDDSDREKVPTPENWDAIEFDKSNTLKKQLITQICNDPDNMGVIVDNIIGDMDIQEKILCSEIYANTNNLDTDSSEVKTAELAFCTEGTAGQEDFGYKWGAELNSCARMNLHQYEFHMLEQELDPLAQFWDAVKEGGTNTDLRKYAGLKELYEYLEGLNEKTRETLINSYDTDKPLECLVSLQYEGSESLRMVPSTNRQCVGTIQICDIDINNNDVNVLGDQVVVATCNQSANTEDKVVEEEPIQPGTTGSQTGGVSGDGDGDGGGGGDGDGESGPVVGNLCSLDIDNYDTAKYDENLNCVLQKCLPGYKVSSDGTKCEKEKGKSGLPVWAWVLIGFIIFVVFAAVGIIVYRRRR